MATKKTEGRPGLDARGMAWLKEIQECAQKINSLQAQAMTVNALITATEAQRTARIDVLRIVYGLNEGDRIDENEIGRAHV